MVLVRDFILANVRRRLGTVQAHGPLMHGVHLHSTALVIFYYEGDWNKLITLEIVGIFDS